ncbi:hypothetical protein M2341_001074 [Sphingobium sp. B7D2B]|uniref:hypothetical protein n=1 Tax=Sphingobium sp. B7D2B TaxID=2940583 RepID=UPI002223F721|nr:hypothetical protein [Sphingobium sp. B7D2B]MCW2365627.1 hypothetical protein [Sphingobium sp. B7D2B]
MGDEMRYSIIAMSLLLAACGQQPSEQSADVAGEAAGPDVAVTRTPGVSLTYSYGFRLPPERLATAQEAHAAQCEALTPARCRITGMSYQVYHNRTISGSLAMKLAPDDARAFGKKGVAIVTEHGGMLTDARIDSEESGAVVEGAQRDEKAIAEERARIEQQLAKQGLPAAERTQLQARLVDLSDQNRQAVTTRAEAERKLADTPVTFSYSSGQVDPSLSDGPLLGAIKDGWVNVVAGIAVLLMLAITLLPWIAAAAGLALAWIGIKRLIARFRPSAPPEE